MTKEAILYTKEKSSSASGAGGKVRCGLCNHHCLINDDNKGICGVRKNQGGKLYTLVYEKAIAENIDPVEKKPLFHFLPGTPTLSIATMGCNFKCLHCQNADISQISEQQKNSNGLLEILGNNLPVEQVVKDAKDNNCSSISYTYTEPTIFIEYALDVMKLAKKEGLKNIWVSNGYMTKEALDLIAPYLDAINIDLKALTEKFYQEVCGAKLKPVLENLKEIKKKKIWLEVTTLLIPTKNDSLKEIEKIANFIEGELGKETPWHVSRFFPTYKLGNLPPTDVEVIRKAVEIGKKAGLKYVYSGNIPGDGLENTYCPKCGEKIIDRMGYSIERFDVNGKCSKCGTNLNLFD